MALDVTGWPVMFWGGLWGSWAALTGLGFSEWPVMVRVAKDSLAVSDGLGRY